MEIAVSGIEDIMGKLNYDDNVKLGFLLGKIEGDNCLIEDVFLPQQKSTTDQTEVSLVDLILAREYLIGNRSRIIGIIKYQAKVKPFMSATDNKSMKYMIPDMGPFLSLAVNDMGEMDYKLLSI